MKIRMIVVLFVVLVVGVAWSGQDGCSVNNVLEHNQMVVRMAKEANDLVTLSYYAQKLEDESGGNDPLFMDAEGFILDKAIGLVKSDNTKSIEQFFNKYLLPSTNNRFINMVIQNGKAKEFATLKYLAKNVSYGSFGGPTEPSGHLHYVFIALIDGVLYIEPLIGVEDAVEFSGFLGECAGIQKYRKMFLEMYLGRRL